MMSTKQLLYQKVEDARESCAGCSVLEKKPLLKKIDETITFALQVNASPQLVDKLAKAKQIVEKEKVFKDRLPADRILCEILNVDLK